MLDLRQLVAARALAGWSQEDLAAAAGVGLATVRGLEAGFRDTRYSSVLAVLEALRQVGVELAQGGERYIGGVVVVRGSLADWTPDMSARDVNPPDVGKDRKGGAQADVQEAPQRPARRRRQE